MPKTKLSDKEKIRQVDEGLVRMDACQDAREWVEENQYTSFTRIWRNCARPDWMLWVIPRISEKEGGSLRFRRAVVMVLKALIKQDSWNRRLTKPTEEVMRALLQPSKQRIERANRALSRYAETYDGSSDHLYTVRTALSVVQDADAPLAYEVADLYRDGASETQGAKMADKIRKLFPPRHMGRLWRKAMS